MTETTRKRKRNRVIVEFRAPANEYWQPCHAEDSPAMFTVAEAKAALKASALKLGVAGPMLHRIVRVLEEFTTTTEQQYKVTFK